VQAAPDATGAFTPPRRGLHACQPWYPVGGITTANAAGVVGAGAEHLAVVRAIGDAADAERAALRALLS
jgi:thiamine monophosphate synthase